MASYHFAVQVISRRAKYDAGSGQTRPPGSAVAAAAYRARCELKNEQTGKVEDYRRKGGLQHAEIMLPEGAAPWLADRSKLWNHVEAIEKRSDAQLVREINMALPYEMTDAQRLELVRGFVAAEFTSRGMVADIAWHKPVAESGDDPRNYHAHILLTLRKATAKGLHPVKTREWNSKELLGEWREAWRDHQNSMLREMGSKARVDHRSLRDQADDAWYRGDRLTWQRLQRDPEIHVGPKARKMHERGVTPEARDRQTGPRRQKYGSNPHAFGYVSQAEREARREARRTERRTVYYSQFSHNTRLDYLSNILLGNDREMKTWLVKKERQLARLDLKMDRFLKQMEWKAEGLIKGRRFRFERARKAAAEREAREALKRKQAHAARRAAQLREIKAELEMVFVAMRGGREALLQRRRQVDAWRERVVPASRQRSPEWVRTRSPW